MITLEAGFPASLYIHIPFCSGKCAYCDFFSVPSADTGLIEKILEAEIRELDFLLESCRPPSIPTLYIGGGTPSVVPPPILADFLRRLFRRLPNRQTEFTVEANPESLSEPFLDVIGAEGANRLSLGIQTFDADRLAGLGRRALPADNRRALETLSRLWKGGINLDQIYGFPLQSPKEAIADLTEILAFGPGHISLYALTPEEGTPFAAEISAGKTAPVDEDRQEDIRGPLHRALTDRGYADYEVSNYALPGGECRHNMRYWELRPYIGIGPGGVSTLPAAGGGAVRLSKRVDLHRYADRPLDREEEPLSPRDFLVDYILMSLRTSRGFRRGAFEGIFGRPPEAFFPISLEKNAGFFESSRESLRLSEEGRRLLDSVLVDMMDEVDGRGFSGPVSWPEQEIRES